MVTITLPMKKIHAIIVSLPGSWQKILQYYIEEYPFIQVDHVASGGLSAIQLLKEDQTDLLVIDSSISIDDIANLVRNVKKMQPDLQIIVIADTTQERHRIRRAGADYAISACNFEMQISEILNQINQRLLEKDANNEINAPSNKQSYPSL